MKTTWRATADATLTDVPMTAVGDTWSAELPAVSDGTWNLVEEGLRRVVEEGTATGARISGARIYGKTGTAQNPHGNDHALFACYLRDDTGRARIALAVIIEQGGHGGAAAVPVARLVLEEYLREMEEEKRAG